MQTYLKTQTGLDLSVRSLQRLLTQLEYGYRRPKRDLGHQHDPVLRDQVHQALAEVKKRAMQAEFELRFMDETIIGLIYPILACWMKRGQQKRLPMTTGARTFQYLAGVLNWRTQAVHCQPLAKMNSEALSTYFEWLLTEIYPHQKLVLVMDNAAWHCSAATQAFLARHEHRILVLWLPPYSPDMNPLERFWKHLKANACANKLYRSLAHLIGGIFNFLHVYADPNYSGRLSFSNNL